MASTKSHKIFLTCSISLICSNCLFCNYGIREGVSHVLEGGNGGYLYHGELNAKVLYYIIITCAKQLHYLDLVTNVYIYLFSGIQALSLDSQHHHHGRENGKN